MTYPKLRRTFAALAVMVTLGTVIPAPAQARESSPSLPQTVQGFWSWAWDWVIQVLDPEGGDGATSTPPPPGPDQGPGLDPDGR